MNYIIDYIADLSATRGERNGKLSRKSALEKRIVSILENCVEGNDQRDGVMRGVIPAWFDELKNEDEEIRESAYSKINGFIWSMYCMNFIDRKARRIMMEQLIELSVKQGGR